MSNEINRWKDNPRQYYKEYHAKHRESTKKKREENKHSINLKQNERRRQNRMWLIELLGGSCSYCGTNSRLEIDHRDGDGTIERRKMKDKPASKYPILFRKGLITTDEIQKRLTLACRWCNVLKGTVIEKEWRAMIRAGVVLDYAQKMKEHNDNL